MADVFYVESGYWDEGYAVYVASADLVAFSNASVSTVGSILFDVSANLNSNFSSSAVGTITAPSGTTKDGEAALTSQATLSLQSSVNKTNSSSLSSNTSLSATISHIEGADLQAFTNASLSVSGQKLLSANASLSSSTSVSCLGGLSKGISAGLTSTSSLSSNSGKLQSATVYLNGYIEDSYYYGNYFVTNGVESLLFADAEVLIPVAVEGEAALTSQFTVLATPGFVKPFSSAISSSASVSATISHIEGADLQAFSNASLTGNVRVIRSLASSVSSTASVSATALKVISFQIDARDYFDNPYYEVGYYEAHGIESTVSVTATRAISVECSLTVTTSVSATISHIEGADLFAFAEAQLAIAVGRIRNNNSQLASQFDLAADGVRGIYISAQADAETSLVTIGARSRAYQAAVDAAFSSTVINSRTRDTSSQVSSNSNLDASLGITKEFNASLQVEGFVLTSFGRIRPEVADLESQFSIAVDVVKTADVSSNLASDTAQSVTITKTFGEFFVPCASEFTSNVSAVITAVESANLDLLTQAVIDNSRTRAFNSTQAVEFSLSVDAETGLIGEANLDSTTTFACEITKTIGVITADLTSQFSIVPNVFVTPSGGAYVEMTATQTVIANRLRDNNIDATATSQIVIDAVKTTEVVSTQAAEFALTSTALRIKQLDSSFDSIASDLFIINKIGNGLVHSDVVASLDSTVVVTADGIASMAATTESSVIANATKPFSSTQTVSSNITTTANVITDATADIQSVNTINISASKQAVVESAITSNTLMSVTVALIGDGISLEFSFADMAVSGRVIKSTPAQLQSTTTLNATVGVAYVGQANLQVSGFQLSTGRKIQLQTAEVWKVPKENRTWVVAPIFNNNNEIIYVVPNEVRTWKIKEERNTWTIESEDRTYII